MSLDERKAEDDHAAKVKHLVTENLVAQAVLDCLLALHGAAPHVAVAVADAFLERTAPDWPDAAPFAGQLSSDADWWADCATDQQMTAMTQACLKRLVMGQMPLAPNARKRALVAIWNTLTEKDRAAFLTYAEPGSAGRP